MKKEKKDLAKSIANIKKDKEDNKYIYIFNIIKIPIIFTCIVSITYLLSCKIIEPLRINQKVYMKLPQF